MLKYLTPEVTHFLTAGLILTYFVLKPFGGVFSKTERIEITVCFSKKYISLVRLHVSEESSIQEGGIGIFGFVVLDIFLIGFSVLVFNAVCGFFVF